MQQDIIKNESNVAIADPKIPNLGATVYQNCSKRFTSHLEKIF